MNRLLVTAAALSLLLPQAGCVRDELEECPPLEIRLEVADKNYRNILAAARLGFEEVRDEELPFREYVSNLTYRLTDAATGEVVAERSLSAVEGDDRVLTLPVDAGLPFGIYVLTAWGNLGEEKPDGDDYTQMALHPGSRPAGDVYLASDTLRYDELDYSHTLGMKRVKGKLIVSVEEMPTEFLCSSKVITGIRTGVDNRFRYDGATVLPSVTRWPRPGSIVTKQVMAPSTEVDASLAKLRFYVGDEVCDNWIAPEVVSLTMTRNQLTILRYIYDPCCCSFKILILINDNWEILHEMEIS